MAASSAVGILRGNLHHRALGVCLSTHVTYAFKTVSPRCTFPHAVAHGRRSAVLKPTDVSKPEYFHKVVDCQWGCPAHTDVPQYIRLIAQGRYTDEIGRASCRERV